MYFITITDYNGKKYKIKVSKEVFEVFDQERKREISDRHKQRAYMDNRALDNPFIQELSPAISLEDEFILREMLEETLRVIESCPPVQKERYILHTIYGYTSSEIAVLHGCSVRAVNKAVQKVREKIFERGFQNRL